MEEAFTHFGGTSVGGWTTSRARRTSIFTTTQEASGSGLCQGRSMKVNQLNIFLITLIIEGQPLLTKASAQPCPHTDDGVPWKYRSTKGRMENDDRSLDLGCGKEAYFVHQFTVPSLSFSWGVHPLPFQPTHNWI